LCITHYIEALEHSAHITTNFGCDYHPVDYNPNIKLDIQLALSNARVTRSLPGSEKLLDNATEVC
jgi:hypothetical protein